MQGHEGLAQPLPRRGFALAWAGFWLLMIVVAVQDHLRHGGEQLWEPLLWEGSSGLVATVVVAALWRRVRGLDALLDRPWRWLLASIAWLPLAAPAFVAAIYALRHGVYALVGQTYRHEAWVPLVRYELLRFAVFYLLFAAVMFGLRSYQALAEARLGLERERALAQRAQLLQLAQQIQPHFLFNALNAIAATVHSDAGLADTLLVKLAALLRAASDLAREPETTLDEELGLLDAYVAIMRQRFADRVAVAVEVDAAARACRLPTLALQPLVENAFRHAVEPRRQPTTITVRAHLLASGRLRVEVDDDGPGPAPGHAAGVGLANLQQRLAARHGGAAQVMLEARPQGGARAWIELPCAC